MIWASPLAIESARDRSAATMRSPPARRRADSQKQNGGSSMSRMKVRTVAFATLTFASLGCALAQQDTESGKQVSSSGTEKPQTKDASLSVTESDVDGLTQLRISWKGIDYPAILAVSVAPEGPEGSMPVIPGALDGAVLVRAITEDGSCTLPIDTARLAAAFGGGDRRLAGKVVAVTVLGVTVFSEPLSKRPYRSRTADVRGRTVDRSEQLTPATCEEALQVICHRSSAASPESFPGVEALWFEVPKDGGLGIRTPVLGGVFVSTRFTVDVKRQGEDGDGPDE